MRVYATHMDLNKNRLGRSVLTNDDGRFTVRGLKDGAYRIKVTVPPVGFLQSVAEGVAVGREDLEYVFGSIGGAIRTETGAPLVGRDVKAFVNKDLTMRAKTDDKGRFLITGLPSGRYSLTIASDKNKPNYLLADARDIEAGRTDLRLTARGGARFTGRVEGDGGAALAGAVVYVKEEDGQGKWTRTAKDGRFEIAGLEEGKSYELHAWTTGRIKFKRTLAAPADLVILLPQGLKVTGRLRDAAGEPLRKTTLRFTHTDGTKTHATTDDEGRFDAGGFAEGEYKVEYWRPTDKPGWIACGKVSAGARNVELGAGS